MRILCLYHRADADGHMSMHICRHYLKHGDNEFIARGWEYGDTLPNVEPYFDSIYMVDICIDELLKDADVRKRVVLIDHHRSASEKWSEHASSFRDYQVHEGVAACRLCWKYFEPLLAGYTMRSFVEMFRKMPCPGEPLALFLIGLRDTFEHVGTKHEDDANLMDFALRSDPLALWDFESMLSWDFLQVEALLQRGGAVARYAKVLHAEHAERGACIFIWENLRWLSLNTQGRGSLCLDDYSRSLEGQMHDALMVWGMGRNHIINVSMYHAPHYKDLDLSQIASKYGGGGHPGACGFRMPAAQFFREVIPI